MLCVYHTTPTQKLFCLHVLLGWDTTMDRLLGPKMENSIKGELGVIQIYFRKIPLHQQNLLVVSVPSNLPFAKIFEKMSKMKLLKHFSVGNTKVYILALTAGSKNKIHIIS